MSKKSNSKFFLAQADAAIKRMKVLKEKKWLTTEEMEEFHRLDKSSDLDIARAMKEFELEQKKRIKQGLIFFSVYFIILILVTITIKALRQ